MAFHDGPIHTIVGLQVSTGKFVNVEKFGDQLSAVAPALKSKQTFRVERDPAGHFFLKTWTNKYLSSNELGVVTASAEAKGKNESWTIEFANGPCFIRSLASGKYIEPSGDTIKASAAAPGGPATVYLLFAIHPQICLENFEDRFMLVDEETADVISPNHYQMGVGTLFTLVYAGNGAYALWSGLNGKFVQVDPSGNLAATGAAATPDCCFIFEWVEDKIAIKVASSGRYLTVQGTKSAIFAKQEKVGQREKWSIVDSHAQVTLLAHNGKYIGHQEATVTCLKDRAKLDEIFLLENEGHQFALRTSDGKYLSHRDGKLEANGPGREHNTLWTVEYPAQGRVSFKTGDGKFLAAKKLGGVYLKAGFDEECAFTVQLLNRPVIALLSAAFNTFVGSMNDKLVTHKATVETFSTEYENGTYAFRTNSGEYISTSGKNVVPGAREWFELHYAPGSKAYIKSTKTGVYLSAEQNGNFVTAANAGANELFEF